jgi:hypothetical protein
MTKRLINDCKLRLSVAGFVALGASFVAIEAQAQAEAEVEVDADVEAEPTEGEATLGVEEDAEEGDSDSDFAPEVVDHREDRAAAPGGAMRGSVNGEEVESPPVIRGAGMGSEIAYGDQGVVELGGQFALDIRDELFSIAIAPTLGYFLVDRFELTLIPIVRILRTEDGVSGNSETFVQVAALLEPSYHLPITDDLFVFGGLGIGFTYEEGPGFAFLLRPVLGLDVMVGRSGILKPAGFIDVGFGDGAIGGGFQAGYTVMF